MYPGHPGNSTYTAPIPLYHLNGSGYLRGTYAYIENWTEPEAYNSSNLFLYKEYNPHVPEVNPSWGPDGSKVAFELYAFGNGGNDIYIFDTSTKQVTRLTDNPASDKFPAWSPDGSKVVFHLYSDLYGLDVYVFDT